MKYIFYEKCEKVPYSCTNSYGQVKITLEGKSSGYSSTCIATKNNKNDTRYNNKKNKSVQLSKISCHEDPMNSS